jgi:mono/diheme cytochrome c family protein
MNFFGMKWLVCLCIAASLVGCGGETKEAEQSGDPEILAVPLIYKQNCLSCHGGDLQGTVGPNLQKIGSQLSEEEIAEIIRAGKGGMPGFSRKLNADEIQQLSSWLVQQK